MNRWTAVNCASLAAILVTLLLFAGSFLPSASAATLQQLPTDSAAVQQPTAAPAPVTVAEARTWATASLSGAGIELPNTTLLFTSESNCGADLSPVGIGGCTYFLQDGSTVIVLSPELAWTEAGSHILFHEAAHATGVIDECAAEEWAHQFEEAPYWAYPACNTY